MHYRIITFASALSRFRFPLGSLWTRMSKFISRGFSDFISPFRLPDFSEAASVFLGPLNATWWSNVVLSILKQNSPIRRYQKQNVKLSQCWINNEYSVFFCILLFIDYQSYPPIGQSIHHAT